MPKETASALVAPLRATPVNTVQRIVAIPDRFPQSRVENWNDLLRIPPDPVPTPHILNTLETSVAEPEPIFFLGRSRELEP